MSKEDPGALPIVTGLLLGALTILGGPAGLVLGGIVGISSYGLGRAIRKSRAGASGQGKKYDDIPNINTTIDWSKYEPYQEEKPITLPPIVTHELPTLPLLSTQNQNDYGIYTLINSIADSHSDNEQDEPEPVQRQTRDRIRIDEYGQIWEE